MELTTKRVVCTTLVVGAIALEIRSRRKLVGKIIADPTSRATAYHGAMTLYGSLATYFGRKAMLAEKAYWEEVDHG